MLEYLHIILVSVATSTTTLLLVIFIVQKYITRKIDAIFQAQQTHLELQLQTQKKLSDFVTDRITGIYPEMAEVVYRLRNIIKDGINEDRVPAWDEDIRVYCVHLTENLYKYRIFIDNDLFIHMHEFKAISQDFLVMHDMCTRHARILDDPSKYADLLKDARAKADRLESLYNTIITRLHVKLAKGG